MKKLKAAEFRNDSEFSYRANDFNVEEYDYDEIDIESGWMGVEYLPLKVIGDDYGMYQTVHSDKDGNYLFRAYNNTDDEIAANFYNKYFSDEYGNYIFEIYYDKIEEKANEGDKEAQDILNGKWDRNLHEYFANEVYSPEQEWEIMSNFMNRFENENKMNIKKAGNYTIFNMTDLLGYSTMKESKAKRTIKEYVEPKTFEDKALFDDFKDSIGGRCFNKDSVYRWVYKLTDIKPTDDEIYEIVDEWVKNKWAYKKENERTGANFYYIDLKETVSESKKNMKRIIRENNMDKRSEIIDFLKSADENVIEALYDALREELNKKDYIILTKEIKQKHPRLKNISMIEAKSEYRTWEESMKYAENLYKGGYNDWRIPTCSGDKRVNDSTDEIYALYEAKEDLHKLAVEQGVEDDFLKSGNYWSNQENENNADYILCVTSDGSIANGIKDFSELSCRCVR